MIRSNFMKFTFMRICIVSLPVRVYKDLLNFMNFSEETVVCITCKSRHTHFRHEEPHLIHTPQCFFSFSFLYVQSHGTFFYVPNPKLSSFTTNHAEGEKLLQLQPRPSLPNKLLRHDLSCRCVFMDGFHTPLPVLPCNVPQRHVPKNQHRRGVNGKIPRPGHP